MNAWRGVETHSLMYTQAPGGGLQTWEERGLMRGRVRRYVLQIMDWEDVPDLPVHELLGQMRNRLMDMKLEAEQA